MQIQKNVSLKHLNTFGIEARAKYFAKITSHEDLLELIKTPHYKNEEQLVLGGGSNVLLTDNFDGLVVQVDVRGIFHIRKDEMHEYIRIGAGENWHEFVLYCIDLDLGGIENLSLIPGSVGAAPMQNIGAYGVEIKEVFHQLEAWRLSDGTKKYFTKDECAFDYRTSIFKTSEKGKYVIAYVTLKLSKQPNPITSYKGVEEKLKGMGKRAPNIRDLSDAIVQIRQEKLPDPKIIGNAGSFFKNPIVEREVYEKIKDDFDDVPGYDAGENLVKIPAAWLIEKCGWKGKRFGDVGVHEKQALVLVNYGEGKGRELRDLALKIKQSVADRFGIVLETEVNVI